MITSFKDYRDLPFSKRVQDELFKRHKHSDDQILLHDFVIYTEEDVLILLQMHEQDIRNTINLNQ